MKNWILKNWRRLWKWITKRSVLIVLIAGALIASIVLTTICHWKWILGGSEPSEVLRNIGLVIVGILGTALAIWRAMIAADNTKINDRNSFTDTFTKSIEQLGAGSEDEPNIEVRLGGIYALEKLSQVNLEYYQPIIDILASYVRKHTPIPDLVPEGKETKKPRLDIQAALTVLGRRDVKELEVRLDLGFACLQGAHLMSAHLMGVKLAGANLYGAHLGNADLRGAYLMDAKLMDAKLMDANLRGANLKGADLRGANLMDAKLMDAKLIAAHLIGAHLMGAYLKDADLMYAHLTGAHLMGANLKGANLMYAHLEGAHLEGANLEGANLEGATITSEQIKSTRNSHLATLDPKLTLELVNTTGDDEGND